MKKNTIIGFLVVISGVFIVSCANQQANTDAKFKALEKQLLQLKAENSNLNSRAKELDDKVMLYEKKKTVKKKKKDESKLRTVRLSPSNYENEPIVEEREETISMASGGTKDENRPVLKLAESHYSSYSHVPATTSRKRTVPAASYKDIPMTHRGDNLGVVTKTKEDGSLDSNAMDVFNSAYRAYNNRDYASAIAGFSNFLQKESNHTYADNAMFWMAECFLAKGQLFKAVGEFERLLKRYPRSEKAASSLYRIGFVYDQLKDHSKAKEYYFSVVDKYPGTEAARKASRRISDNEGHTRLVRTSTQR